MARKQPKVGTFTVSTGGHTLTLTILNGRRYFNCDSWPDLAEKYDGAIDAVECIDEFERRATAGAAPVTETKPQTEAKA